MRPERLAGVLVLAATPAFFAMALLEAWRDAEIVALCGSGPASPDAMTAMYMLMALFHLGPWLRLTACWGRRAKSG